MRLYSAYMYTDDALFIVVGAEGALLALRRADPPAVDKEHQPADGSTPQAHPRVLGDLAGHHHCRKPWAGDHSKGQDHPSEPRHHSDAWRRGSLPYISVIVWAPRVLPRSEHAGSERDARPLSTARPRTRRQPTRPVGLGDLRHSDGEAASELERQTASSGGLPRSTRPGGRRHRARRPFAPPVGVWRCMPW